VRGGAGECHGKSRFLNVDLDLHGTEGRDRLIAAVGDDVVVLNRDQLHEMAFAVLELREPPVSIDDAIRRFSEAIGNLLPDLCKVWNGLEKRTMNVGIEAGRLAHSTEFAVSENTLATLIELRCDLAFTIYRADEAELKG
jgi:hypothetical protein